MPRIVPIQLLKCLKVLLDDNGGILSAGEVKRLASLMTKYSKKLVSKCIYVQILKCTKTELLGEFMGAGGWSLVYTWLNDAIRAMNWPLVQEILELLLLCPVDVHRLKINSAPKLVKGLCKDGGNEGVRILAKRLVEQWLKVVTENPEATLPTSNVTPQATAIKTPTVAVVAPEAISVNVQQQQTSVGNSTNQNTPASTQQDQLQQKQQKQPVQQKQEEQKNKSSNQQKLKLNKRTKKAQKLEEEEEAGNEEEETDNNNRQNHPDDQDPLGGVDTQTAVTNYTLTPAQKKASESGLVYKFIIKDGQSILAKVPPKSNQPKSVSEAQSSVEEEEEEAEPNDVIDEDPDETETPGNIADNSVPVVEADENSSSLDKTEKDNDSNSGSEEKPKLEDIKKSEDKKLNEDIEKPSIQKDRRSSKDKERHGSSNSIDKEKEKDKDSKFSKSSSSSSSHRSSSSHKSSSKSSSSSSSKSKSSSSSHRSSSDKHRSDKERSSSSKDKDKDRSSSSSSSSSSKHRSSSSSKSSSKDKHRDKEKSSSSSSKVKDKQEQSQSEKEKITLEKVASSSSIDKVGKIPKKSKESSGNDVESSNKPTSITIPSKKASMSIEIRKDTEKAKTVKTYKSQFRSHGLTEEAPPPPSRKGLKKPSSTPPGTMLPSSLPSSLKRTSPTRDSPLEKKAKIDINNVSVANEKPGAIKLIPPKKIQTLVETNLFSDALSAAMGPKKVAKRKRPNTPLVNGKEGPLSPTSPDGPKVVPLKFYQDTLDESKNEDSKPNKESDEGNGVKSSEEDATVDDKDIEDDDDIPLKKVKEDIEQKVAKEKKMDCGKADAKIMDITKDHDEEKQKAESGSSPSRNEEENSPKVEEDDIEIAMERKPGPGCGPNGPPGVLMLHRRKGPKKKLSWHPQESLEQIRYFELDENERCNVTKTSFLDMKNMERFNERDAIVMARRGFNHEDNMDVQTHWKPLIEVDDVPPHPEGNQSKQRKIQAERELTTLRALYFSHALIPDSPAEAEFEPAFNHDVPLIPLEDLTGNPDAVNDFTSMPWPEPRGSPKQGDNSMAGTGGLGSPVNMFGSPTPPVVSAPSSNKPSGGNPYNPFVNPFAGNKGPNGPNGPPMQNSSQSQWQGPGNVMGGSIGSNGPMMGNTFTGNHGSPIVDIGPPGPMGPGPMMNNGPPQNFMNQFSPNFVGPPNPFMAGPSAGFNNGPNNFGPMGPNGPMMNGMGPGPMGNNFPPQMMNGGHNNRNNRGNNNGGNWRSGGGPNFLDNSGGGGGNWRPAGPGHNIRGGGGGVGNNGVCKAFMRGHCRLGNSCKYIHPNKSKRI